MKKSIFIILGIILALGIIAGTAYAFTDGGVIHACVKDDGQVRIVKRTSDCKPQETYLEWSIVGPKGEKGDQGSQGEMGPVGPAAPQGEQGIQGEIGPMGLQGPQGEKGDTGDMGAIGPAGSVGATGAKGDMGDTGLAGPQGPKGDIGPQGPAGSQGAPGILSFYTKYQSFDAGFGFSVGYAYCDSGDITTGGGFAWSGGPQGGLTAPYFFIIDSIPWGSDGWRLTVNNTHTFLIETVGIYVVCADTNYVVGP